MKVHRQVHSFSSDNQRLPVEALGFLLLVYNLPFAFNALAFAAAAKVTDGSNRFVLFDNSIPFIPLPFKFP